MAICINCMTCEQTMDGVCPVCGKKDEDIHYSRRYLPWRYMLNNRYMVGRSIGKGGFANTYIAYDKVLRTRVAIKEFYPKDDVERDYYGISVVPVSEESAAYFSEQVAKFVDEAGRLARFRSETGVVTVHDIFYENNTSYIVMDYIDGLTLHAYIKSIDKPMTFDQVMNLMTPMLKTLSRMHESGMVHRDISPDNIMLTKNPTRIYLIDFGSAREASPVEGRRTMSVSYKDSYSPPEQYDQEVKQGPWSDVYAICATIYRCITLKMPQGSVVRAIEDELKRPSELGAVITPHQEEVLMKGLAIKPQNRIQSVKELLNLLKTPSKHGEEHLQATPSIKAEAKVNLDTNTKPQAGRANNLKSEYEEDLSVTKAPEGTFVEINGKKLLPVNKSEYEKDLPVTVSPIVF